MGPHEVTFFLRETIGIAREGKESARKLKNVDGEEVDTEEGINSSYKPTKRRC